MVGTVGDMAQALATLQRERARLLGMLRQESGWQAWLQLEAREADGDPIDGIDSGALRKRLAGRLDLAVPGWRALAGIEVALTALTATPMLAQPPEAATEPEGIPSPVEPAEQPLPLGAGAPRSELQSRLDLRETAPIILDSAADARNRSLVQAMGAIHALGASGDAAKATEPPDQRPAAVCDLNARAVLGRIRSVDGERRAAVTGSSATTGIASRPPVSTPSSAGTFIQSVPEPPVAAHPVAAHPVPPEPTPAAAVTMTATDTGRRADRPAATSAPEPNPDSAARIAALEQELERLMRHTIEARKPPGLTTPSTAAIDSSSIAERFNDDLDENFPEEAEIEIVVMADGAEPPGDDLNETAVSHDDRDGPGPLTRQLRRSQARQAAEADHYAIYHGIIDEASVEIVQLAPAPASAPSHRPPLHLVRDD